MMSKPMYLLKGTLYRDKALYSNLIEIHEEFYDESPITARKKAFSKYQSYVEVLLESRNISSASYQQAKDGMQHFMNAGMKQHVLHNPDLEIDTDFDKGLFLYFIPNPTKKIFTKENEKYYSEKYLIHLMDNNKTDLQKHVFEGLIFEYDYYANQNFNTDQHVSRISQNGISGKVYQFDILRTPLTDILDVL